MSIELDPAELGFRRWSHFLSGAPVGFATGADLPLLLGPFTQEVTQVLRLRNPNSDPLAFKASLHCS